MDTSYATIQACKVLNGSTMQGINITMASEKSTVTNNVCRPTSRVLPPPSTTHTTAREQYAANTMAIPRHSGPESPVKEPPAAGGTGNLLSSGSDDVREHFGNSKLWFDGTDEVHHLRTLASRARNQTATLSTFLIGGTKSISVNLDTSGLIMTDYPSRSPHTQATCSSRSVCPGTRLRWVLCSVCSGISYPHLRPFPGLCNVLSQYFAVTWGLYARRNGIHRPRSVYNRAERSETRADGCRTNTWGFSYPRNPLPSTFHR